MDTTYIIGIVLALVVVLAMLLLHYSKNIKDSQLTKQLAAISGSSAFPQQEAWNGHLIALDEDSKTLYFIRNTDTIQSIAVNLNDFASCKCVKSHTLGASASHIDMIGLAFAPKDAGKEPTTCVFFDADIDGFTPNGELQSAEKWEKICSTILKG